MYGVEHPKRKSMCNQCGAFNVYPYEKEADVLPRLEINAKLYIPIGRNGETPEALDARFVDMLDEIGAEFASYTRDVVDIDGESLNYEWEDIGNEEE